MSLVSQLTEAVDAALADPNRIYKLQLTDQNGNFIGGGDFNSTLLDPFNFDPSLVVPGYLGLPDFYNLAAEVIESAQKKDGTVEEEIAGLVKEYQPEEFHMLGDVAFAVKLIKREPAKLSKDGNSFVSRRGFHFEEMKTPEMPNKVVQVQARPIDHEIEFQCWSKSNLLADKYALWLEQLFYTQAWIFRIQGADRFHFIKRGPDTVWKQGEAKLHYRPLTFFVRLTEYELMAHPALKRVEFEFKTTR